MPAQKGTQGKIIVQNWDMLSSMSNTPLTADLRLISKRMQSALISIAAFLAWRTRYKNPPSEDELDAFASETMYRILEPIDICEYVIDCIENDDDVRRVLNNFISKNVYGSPEGVPQTTDEKRENQAGDTNPTCDTDVLWAQCLAVVQQTNRSITDAFEVVEGATNSIELADAVSELPIVGWIKDAVGVQAALDLITYYQNSIAEGYAAQYTTEIESEIACQLFCICRGDCKITTERVFQMVSDRIATHLDIPDVADIFQVIEFVTGVTVTGVLVVDLAFYMAWASVTTGNFLFAGHFNVDLQMLLALSVNDANDDWLLLCDDCPSIYCDDFEEGVGVKSFVPSVANPFGVWDNDGGLTNTEQEGGQWSASGGYTTDLGCIISTAATGITNGQRINVGIDLGSTRQVGIVTWRGKREVLVSPAFATEYITLLDDDGNLITNVDMGTTGANWEERSYDFASAEGRYVVVSAIAGGFTYRFDDVCVNYA